MTYAQPCITVVLRDFADCDYPATHGEVCEACFDRIERAIIRAASLRIALAGVDRAMTPESRSTVAGPRLPLTALSVDFDEINRYQQDHIDPVEWVSTQVGAEQAVRFARAVHRADLAHPTVAAVRKLQRVRCPACRRLTAVVRPPDWYGDAITVECLHCKWEATNPDAVDIVANIETRGRLNDGDLIMLELRARRSADRRARKARARAKADRENAGAA